MLTFILLEIILNLLGMSKEIDITLQRDFNT